jgi:ABC-type phosphate transport system substrate-binding protein
VRIDTADEEGREPVWMRAGVATDVAAAPPGAAAPRAASARREIGLRVSRVAHELVFARLEAPFEARYPDLDLMTQPSSDRGCIDEVAAGHAAACITAAELTDQDVGQGLTSLMLGQHVLALAVAEGNAARSVTQMQARELLVGEAKEWNRVAYQRGEVEVLHAWTGPMLSLAATELIPGDHFAASAVQGSDEAEVLARVAGKPRALGVVSLRALERASGVRALAIDGVLPDPKALQTNRYAPGVTLRIVYPLRADPGVRALLEFARSEAGRAIAAERLSVPP